MRPGLRQNIRRDVERKQARLDEAVNLRKSCGVGHRIQLESGKMSTDIKSELVSVLPRLRRYTRSLCYSAELADDLVQETCLRALGRSEQWDPAQPLDRWVFRIARNLWISEQRKAKVRLGLGHVQAEESTELLTPESGEAFVAQTELHREIQSLPSELSEVLLLVCAEGYSYKEASEHLNTPIGTVMSRIHRARKTLASTLAEGV